LQTFITALLNTKLATSIAPPQKQNSRRAEYVQDFGLQMTDRKLFYQQLSRNLSKGRGLTIQQELFGLLKSHFADAEL
jgi:hypothetical protein